MDHEREKSLPECFADLDKVFPMGEDGLRHTPEACMACPEKTPCLRAGMQAAGGDRVREEIVDRAYDSGVIGFFQRWSKKKKFYNKRNRNTKSE